MQVEQRAKLACHTAASTPFYKKHHFGYLYSKLEQLSSSLFVDNERVCKVEALVYATNSSDRRCEDCPLKLSSKTWDLSIYNILSLENVKKLLKVQSLTK